MIIALDRQHVGKPGKRIADMGAWGDLDGDGEASVIESEAIWTGMYLWYAELALRELGHIVYPMSHGRYSERHKAANEVGADVYIAAHLNSLTGGTRSGQGGNYGAVFYDHRSSEHNGLALAESIGLQLGVAAPLPIGHHALARSKVVDGLLEELDHAHLHGCDDGFHFRAAQSEFCRNLPPHRDVGS